VCYSLWYNAPTMLPATGNTVFIQETKNLKDELHNGSGTQNTKITCTGMDSNSFERINLCQITQCKKHGQMQTILPSVTNKNTLISLRELMFF